MQAVRRRCSCFCHCFYLTSDSSALRLCAAVTDDFRSPRVEASQVMDATLREGRRRDAVVRQAGQHAEGNRQCQKQQRQQQQQQQQQQAQQTCEAHVPPSLCKLLTVP